MSIFAHTPGAGAAPARSEPPTPAALDKARAGLMADALAVIDAPHAHPGDKARARADLARLTGQSIHSVAEAAGRALLDAPAEPATTPAYEPPRRVATTPQ